MKKKIWIVNFHTAPERYTLNQRYIKIIPYLVNAGFDVTVVTSSFLRRHNIDLSEDKTFNSKTVDGIPFIFIKTSSYKGNGFRRMWAIFTFSLKFYFMGKKFGVPDIVYHNLHVPFDAPVYFGAKRFKAKYIAEVWDLWPEFFHRMGLIRKEHFLMKLAYSVERWIYNKAAKIVFTMEGGVDYLKEKKWDRLNGGEIDLQKVNYINNGIDLNQFELDKQFFPCSDPLFFDGKLNVVYVGSMHTANNVMQLIKAAELLVEFSNIRFLLYGDGSDRQLMENYCLEKKLDNVVFKDKYVPFNQLPDMLTRSALNIMNYQKDFGEFGISAGKLFLYLAAGKPILSNVNVNYCIIEKNNLGISKNMENANMYAESILSLLNLNEEEYQGMCSRVKEAAKEFDYSKLADKLIKILEEK